MKRLRKSQDGPAAAPAGEVKEEEEDDEDDEIEEVSMQVVLADQVECKEEKVKVKRKRAKAKAAPRGKLRKPKLPQFAFEKFREEVKENDEEEEPSLPELVTRWKAMSDEERGRFIQLAEEDRRRFEREYEEWREERAQLGKPEPALQALLEKRRSTLERKLNRSEEPPKKLVSKKRAPKNFPKRPVNSAYSLFCSEQPKMSALPEEEAPEPVPSEEGVAEDAQKAKQRRSAGRLVALQKAWSALSDEEKRGYAVRAAEDQERFRRELEAWRKDPANEELVNLEFVEKASKFGRKASAKQQKLPRPRVKRSELVVRPARDEEIFFDILTGTQAFAAKERAAHARETAEKRHVDETGEDALPDSGPAFAMENAEQDDAVDDLLGDLLAVEETFEVGPASAFGSSVPQAAGLGPQLCLDESGNIVLNQSSLSQNVNAQGPFEEASATVQEAVSQYAGAFKKTPSCKWTSSETELFYEALSLYGTDLFLVQTFFRNKSAGQIKTKYQKEMKRNPHLVEEALTVNAKRLTKETFERLHGKIDTSKHYKPPPSPQPGDEPEPDPAMPEEEDDMADLGGMPPPEPEYCAEDESLTTNRLMALFD
ncbi:unnamed protein product [Durusdinium trenchii]|uniref:HMG box domain-containing protein n=1 Tax=Durusdinium trenchii TaxID=1381693 RepID=A0ABP0J621_9DINO